VRPARQDLPALLVARLTRRRWPRPTDAGATRTKRQAMVAQLVNKSTTTDLHATKMLIYILKKAKQKAGSARVVL
jgi:hypothetical protein